MEDLKTDVVILFSFGSYSFALPKEYIEKIAHCLPISNSCSLPKIFSGFFTFGKSHLPCLRLDRLISFSDFDDYKSNESSKIVVLRSSMQNAKNKLGLLIDEIEATFVVRSDRLIPVRKELRKNKWLQGEIVFRDKTYLLINQNNLLTSIEDYCVAEISNYSSL